MCQDRRMAVTVSPTQVSQSLVEFLLFLQEGGRVFLIGVKLLQQTYIQNVFKSLKPLLMGSSLYYIKLGILSFMQRAMKSH